MERILEHPLLLRFLLSPTHHQGSAFESEENEEFAFRFDSGWVPD